jgi:phage-related tail protein
MQSIKAIQKARDLAAKLVDTSDDSNTDDEFLRTVENVLNWVLNENDDDDPLEAYK